MNSVRFFSKRFLVLVFVITFISLLVHVVQAVTVEPGTDDDPIVTKSYVDAKAEDLLKKTEDLSSGISDNAKTTNDLKTQVKSLDTDLKELKDKVSKLPNASELSGILDKVDEATATLKKLEEKAAELEKNSTVSFKLIKVTKGKQLLGEKGTEIILRSGSAISVTGSSWLFDLTSTADIKNGKTVPLKHTLLNYIDKKIGFKALQDTWVIVKGRYEIK